MKEHKKRFRIEFTVNVRNEGFDREDWDWSNEHIKSFALQELTCMSPFPDDITFSEVEDTWHTGTPIHGRSIDADKLTDIIVRCINDAEKEYPKEDFDLVKTVYESCLYHIMNAPTVLEATGGRKK